MLTGKQRYWQAVRKARIMSARQLRQMLEGKRDDSGECTMDMERRFLIAEFDRLIAVLSQRGLQTGIGMSTGGGSKAGEQRIAVFIDALTQKGVPTNDLAARRTQDRDQCLNQKPPQGKGT